MINQKLLLIIGSVCVVLLVAGYIGANLSADVTNTEDNTTTDVPNDDSNTANNSTEPETPDTTNNDNQSGDSETTDNPDNVTAQTPSVGSPTLSNIDSHEDAQDYVWDNSDIVSISLNTNSISANSELGLIIDHTTVTITSAGTYSISGTLNDGQIVVDTNDEDVVRLILNGVNIKSTTNAPIFIKDAEKAIIILADNTENILTDGQNNQDNGTISSTDNLTIYGDGSLTVTANANDAIRSNDGLIIKSGTITVNSVDDGIRGKDYLVIEGGTITVNSVGDGLKSDNDEEEDKGYIYIQNAIIDVTSTEGDAIAAQTDLFIINGTFILESGGGSSATLDADISTKGLKSGVGTTIESGVFVISSSDDAVHSNNIITINGGTFELSTRDDAIHANNAININAGTIEISQSYEGIESANVTVNGGYIQITASDDAINLAGTTTGTIGFGGFNPRPGGGGGGFEQAGDYYLYVNGGTIVINSGGDGVDSNGHIVMTDGLLIVNGPTSNMNAAIDYGGGTFTLTGGTVIASGSSGMAQGPSTTSTQNSVIITFSSTQPANTLVNIQTASGETVLTFSPTKSFQSLVFSSASLTAGEYNIYLGGSSTGTVSNGVYEDGTYTGGTQYASFTISNVVTSVGGYTTWWP